MTKLTINACGSLIVLFALAIVTFPLDVSGLAISSSADKNSITIFEGEFEANQTSLTHLFAREIGHATVRNGTKVDRLVAAGQSRIDIADSSEVIYAEAKDKAIIYTSDSTVGYLIMKGESQTYIRNTTIRRALYPISGAVLTEGGIIFETGATIHIWADNTSFEKGRLKGTWTDGKEFSILLVRFIKDENRYEIVGSMPRQVIIHRTDDPTYFEHNLFR